MATKLTSDSVVVTVRDMNDNGRVLYRLVLQSRDGDIETARGIGDRWLHANRDLTVPCCYMIETWTRGQ